MKAEESVTNYFSYVKNVLGVRAIQSAKLQEALLANPPAEVTEDHASDVLFVNLKESSAPSSLTGEARELMDKMISAMKLGAKTFDVQEVDAAGFARASLQQKKAPFIVVFTEKPEHNGVIHNLGTHKYLETFSPSYLLKNAAAKKVAWADLQKVMKEVGVL